MENPKIRFKGFTKDWEQRKLGDVIDDMYNGQTPSRNKSEYWNGTIKWLSSGELNRGTVYDSIETITEEGQKAANLKIVPKGTFVMAITGLEAAGTRGNCALLGFDTTLNQSCMALFPKQEMLTSEFLFQWYRKVGEEYGINYTQGTKQQSYNAELIKILPISLPSVVEQREISSYLSHLDHLITLHQRKCEQTKKLKKYMLQKMFPQNGAKVPEIRFDGFTYDWEQRKLGATNTFFTDGNYGEAYPKSSDMTDSGSGVPFLTGGNLKDGKLSLDGASYITPEKHSKLTSGHLLEDDIVIAVRGSLGALGYVNTDNSGWNINSQLAILRTDKSELYGKFLIQYLLSWTGQNELLKRQTGSALKQLPIGAIKDVEVPITSIAEQEKIGEYLDSVDHLITLHQRKCDELKKMKKYMLQNMFI
ncbi:restriction endonuclease subunit S [Agathobacter rectalis]|uniref:restriction endonuclease subunit S n=1 Tax=Agathobacter rectalis TaxID=39491 RepID=UPI0032192924